MDVTPLLFDGSRTLSDEHGRRSRGADCSSRPRPRLHRTGRDGDPVLRHFRRSSTAAKPKSLVYLSTVGVYGDHDGAWVDETSECRPVSKRSKERVAAENAWRVFSDETGVPVAIIRLAGIYGPGRGPFEKIRRGTARRIIKPGQVFNRIHVDDIAQIVEAAFERRANGIFNGTDDEPAPPQDVLTYAAELLAHAAAARSRLRRRRAHADGAQFLRREQARAERQDQARTRRAARVSDLSRGAEAVCGGSAPIPSAMRISLQPLSEVRTLRRSAHTIGGGQRARA